MYFIKVEMQKVYVFCMKFKFFFRKFILYYKKMDDLDDLLIDEDVKYKYKLIQRRVFIVFISFGKFFNLFGFQKSFNLRQDLNMLVIF